MKTTLSALSILLVLCLCSNPASAQKTSPEKKKHPKVNKLALFKEKDVAYAPSGLAYKFRLDVPGRTATVNDVVQLNFILKNSKDSILRSTVAENRPVISTIQKSRFQGSFEEGLQMLSKGDSCAFWILADSLFAKGIGADMPPFIEKGSYLKFEVKMLDVWTMEEYVKEQEIMAKKTKIEEDQLLAKYIKDNNIAAAYDTLTGLYYQVIKEGTGAKPKKGNKVTVQYTGHLLNGEIFDSSVERNEPFEFVLGQGYVIDGWDLGIPMIRKGEKGVLYIPSYLGYGEQRVGSIPAHSILIFEVELVDFK